MKTLFAASLILLCASLMAQNILLVDNTPSAPAGTHVYTSLNAALSAATAGDIIHVKPSGLNHGNITISSAQSGISIYGIGINPDKEVFVKSSMGQLIVNASDITIAGIVFTSVVYVGNNNTVSNVSFENCQFNSTTSVSSGSFATSNVFFRNCFFLGLFQTEPSFSNNTVVTNSIFNYWNDAGQIYAYNGTIFSNCLFYGSGGTRYAFHTVDGSLINNCIFYGRSPLPNSSASNTTFSHCYVEGNTNNAFPTGNGIVEEGTVSSLSGSVFATPVALGNAWNLDWDATLDPASIELVNGGNDGTDIGLTGGSIPFSKTASSLPYVKKILMPSLVRKGEDLNVTIEVKGN